MRDSELVRAKKHVCGVNRKMGASEQDRETVSVCDRERKKRESESKIEHKKRQDIAESISHHLKSDFSSCREKLAACGCGRE